MTDSDQFREVIAPDAFDAHLPAEIPLTDMNLRRIGTTKVSKDDTGLILSVTIPGPDGDQELTGHISLD